jgi:tyrosyl-tRNA synthetase
MGKSLDNYIGVNEPAQLQFDKTMSIPDDLMREWFTLLTNRSPEEIDRLADSRATHPMAAKKTLGRDIVTFYHGEKAAAEAQSEWEKRFSGRQDPTDITEREMSAAELVDGRMPLYKLLVLLGLAKSNNEARRHVEGGGVSIGPDRTKITEPTANVPVTDGLVVRFGNRRVVRLRLR